MEQEKMTLEDAIKELESLSKKAESESISLEDSVKLYERAMYLARFSREKLASLQARINVVSGDAEEPFPEEPV